jgi:hypothetical protein
LTGGFFAVGAVFGGDLGAGGFLLAPVLMSGFFFEAVTLPFLTRGFGELFTGAFFSWAGFFAATLLTGFSLVFLTNDLEGFTPFLWVEEAFPEDLPDLDDLDNFFNG